MRPIIDWKECLKDSPSFRAALEDAEEEVDSLEIHLEKLLKQCDCMLETGKIFNTASSSFISSLREIMTHFNDDCLVLEALGKFSQTLSDWQNYHCSMLDQCSRRFSQNINNFIKTDIRKVKESRKHFHKLADEMDSALYRSAQAPRSKPDDCEEMSAQLSATRTNFTRASLQHVLEMNLMQIKKRLDLLNALLSYVQTQSKFVCQGYELFANLEPYNQKLTSDLAELQRKAIAERNHVTDKHKTLLSGEFSVHNQGGSDEPNQHPSSDIKMEGYLFKRTSNAAFKTWVRRWFLVENNHLMYCSRQRSRETMTVIEKDLRLCNVKLCYDMDRRFCFQVTSPLRSHILQADSESECLKWVSAIQDGATKAYNRQSTPVSPDMTRQDLSSPRRFSVPVVSLTSSKEMNQTQPLPQPSRHVLAILSVAGNGVCCDCGLNDPRWASINLGITLCIECSGIHRSFGVHKSKVRSLTLDAWDEDHVRLMEQLGNSVVNCIYEAAVDGKIAQRARPHCSRAVRESWITAKYLQKSFVSPEAASCLSRLAMPSDAASRCERGLLLANVQYSFNQSSSIKQVPSQDSGLGGSTDVIQCGSNVSDQSVCLDDSHSAISDLEADADILSVSATEYAVRPCASSLLCKAAQVGSIPEMLRALALGANPNWNCKAEQGRTPLIRAIESGNILAMEFLLLNGAKTDVTDDLGRTPLHHATLLRLTTHVYQLIKRNANQHLKDVCGHDALDIAVKNMDANIVTLLRLARLNEEMKESDALYDIQDEMFSEVFKDFGNLKGLRQMADEEEDTETEIKL